MKKYYTVYRISDDEIIAAGNSEECTKILGLKNIRQFYAFVSKTRSGIRKRYAVVVEDIDETGDE